jgi:hypothetical protein
MSKQSQAKSKAQAFQSYGEAQPYDIRDRDVNARGGFDPRYDKRTNKSNETPTPASTPTPDSIPTFDNKAPKPGKVETPLAKPEASIQAPPVMDAEPPEFNPSNALYYGDSLATGLGHGGARGNNDSDAMWGRGAADTLALLNNRPDGTFRGRDVVLSSGVLNSGADWDTVRSQVRLLQNRGANSVRLVGAPLNNDRFGGYNQNLSSISDELGINFLGGYTPGSDGVHFDYTSSPVYRPLN